MLYQSLQILATLVQHFNLFFHRINYLSNHYIHITHSGQGVCRLSIFTCAVSIRYLPFLRVNSLKNSLKASTPNESPITVPHCPDVIGASLKSDCIPGTRRTSNVSAVTNAIVSQSHLFVNILWVNHL